MNDYREALKRDPGLARARLGLADELRKAHRNVEAAAEYDRCIAREPNDSAAHLGAGQNLLEMDDLAAATRHLDRALALDPKNALVLKQFAEADLNRGDFAGRFPTWTVRSRSTRTTCNSGGAAASHWRGLNGRTWPRPKSPP